MKINIQCINFNSKDSLIEYINKKVGKLEVFFDGIIDVDVFLKLDNAHDKENKVAEIRLHIPGEDALTKKNARSFEEAVDLCVQAQERILKRSKQKNRSL